MLDVEELIAQQRPGFSLQQRFYTDPALYELELERVILRNWVLAGHESEWQEAGDFRVFEQANESAILVKGSDGEIRGFANVCRHRGSRLCLEPAGHTDKFSCPYHGWRYDIDGRLLAARSMPADFDKSAYSLRPISTGIIHGLVFVAFNDRPPSLAGALRDLAEPMALFDFRNLKLAARKRYDIEANWKLSVENYQECYHCATAHPEYASRHTLMVEPRRREALQQSMRSKMAACGLRPLHVDYIDTAARAGEMGYGYSRTALFDGYVTGSREGTPLAPLLGDLTGYDGGASDFSFGAFSFLLAYSDHVVCYVFTPVDLKHSRCRIDWLVRHDAREGIDYDCDELTWLWDVTMRADKKIIEDNAKGVASRFYEPGPFSEFENAERIYTEWLLQELRRR